jgi:hypothetical protein
MKKEDMVGECSTEKAVCKKHHCRCGSTGSPIYCLGVIGALFYFLQGANTFGAVMTGIGKSFFWPAILMFKLLTYLQM